MKNIGKNAKKRKIYGFFCNFIAFIALFIAFIAVFFAFFTNIFIYKRHQLSLKIIRKLITPSLSGTEFN